VEPSDVPGKVSGFPLQAGDVVREETAGGGGYGDALVRQPARVAEDVRQGYLTAAQAAARYGVVLAGDGSVDEQGSAERRREIHAARVMLRLDATQEEMFDGPRRQFLVGPAAADALGISDGDLVEINTGRGAPVRGWARFADHGDGLAVGPSSLDLAGGAAGDVVELRAVRAAPD
jgi:N-methylhydantoinase B